MDFWDEKKVRYTEILELYVFCKEHGINAELHYLFDGFQIRFTDGSDIIQHHGSYKCNEGCVEPAIGCPSDYTAVELSDAKSFVMIYKNQLNGGYR